MMQPAPSPVPQIVWPTPPAALRLDDADAHVWAFTLDLPAESLSRLAPMLSAAELERAARFRFEVHRNRFIVGRAVLRRLLGQYLQTHPANVTFAHGPQGKPTLAGAFARAGWHFNLTHSENLALLAVTHSGPIGVDVEYLQPLADADELVARFFSARECAAYQKLPASERTVAFFNLWTRKEAWLKATGEGIGHLLNQVEVSFLPGEPARLLHLPKLPQSSAGDLEGLSAANWSLQALAPAPNFAAALALSAPLSHPHYWHWDDRTQNRPSDFGVRISCP